MGREVGESVWCLLADVHSQWSMPPDSGVAVEPAAGRVEPAVDPCLDGVGLLAADEVPDRPQQRVDHGLPISASVTADEGTHASALVAADAAGGAGLLVVDR